MNQPVFALLIAETHTNDEVNQKPQTSNAWKHLMLNWTNSLPSGEKTYRLTENVWQIRLDNGLPVLAGLIQAMKDGNIPHRVLFLDDTLSWIQTPPVAR